MLVAVYEEVWPLPTKPEVQPKIRGPVAAGDGYKEARAMARTMAEKFQHSGYEREFDYWWGRNDGAAELYRYAIRAS
jgi:hypothetical protein